MARVDQPARVLSIAEVAQHNTPEDCWVIVDRGVYNVTSFVPRHPGGDIIAVRAGGDCSHLFNSYHPLSARRVLEKFHIGDLDVKDPAAQALLEYEPDLAEGQFYYVLKQRVERLLKDKKIDPRFSLSMYVKTAVIFSSIVLGFWGAFFGGFTLPVAMLAATVLGVGMAEVGVSVMHDANHGAYSRWRPLSRVMAASLDLVGASSFMWRQQHVVGHHTATNLDDVDPDIRVGERDVRRVTGFQPQHPYHAYQHVYLGLLYGLLGIKSVLVDDFSALAAGRIGSVHIAKLTMSEKLVFWGGKAFFAAWFVAAPLLWSGLPLWRLALLWLWSEAVVGWVLAFMFQVAHVTPDVEYLTRLKGSGKVDKGWAAAQVATTADFSHGSWFWTHISGGLNYQVVHHLFPGVCHTHYPQIAPVIQSTCREFGIPYVVYPTFWAALGAHFQHLKNMGAPTKFLPSLATVG